MIHHQGLSGSEIRHRTNRCKEQFSKCLACPIIRECQWLKTGSDDFDTWDLSLNASHFGRSSLDSRVRQRPDLSEAIIDLLDGLDESLCEYLDESLGERLDGSLGECICMGQAKIDNPKGFPGPEENLENPLHYNVSNIKTILKALTWWQNAIRKSGAQLRHLEADNNLRCMVEKNANGLEEFREDMIAAILAGLERWDRKEGLPKPWGGANMKLIERFVNANVKRRNRIFFAIEEMEKIKVLQPKERQRSVAAIDLEQRVTETVIAPRSIAGEETEGRQWELEGISKAGEIASEPSVNPLSRQGSLDGQSQAPTTVTTISLDAIIDLAPPKVFGTTITKATDTAQGQTYPLPPKWPKDSMVTHTNCPYCSNPLTKKHTEQAAWNDHVSNDIFPYICFIEDCKTPDDLYQTSEELTKHVISEHGVSCWVCDECTPDTKQNQFKIFETAELWREHLLHSHSQTISDAIFPRLAELRMHKMVPPIKCPLCDYATSEIKPSIDPEIIRHIHQFSIRSLPWEARDEENLSEEHLMEENSSASTSNSSNDRRQNARSLADVPNPNHEGMRFIDYEQIRSTNLTILERLYTSRCDHTALCNLRGKSFYFYQERIWHLDKTSCELLLPALVQLYSGVEEVLAFKRYGREWNKDQENGFSLGIELYNNLYQLCGRVVHVLGAVFDSAGKGALIKTKYGIDAYIRQWRSLIGQDFIPGDPDYVPRDEEEEAVLTLQKREPDPREKLCVPV